MLDPLALVDKYEALVREYSEKLWVIQGPIQQRDLLYEFADRVLALAGNTGEDD